MKAIVSETIHVASNVTNIGFRNTLVNGLRTKQDSYKIVQIYVISYIYLNTVLILMAVINTMVKTDSSEPTTSRTPSMEHSILLRHLRSTKQYSPSTDRLLTHIARIYTWIMK